MNAGAESSPWPWVAWSSIVTTTAGVVGLLSHEVLDRPSTWWLGFAFGLLTIPVALVGTTWRFARLGHPVLVRTIVLAGMVLMVCGLYVAVPIALGQRPTGDERGIYVTCLVATVVACALAFPARHRLERWARGVAGAARVQPDEVLATLGHRMTRAVPMDELLLQVVETLRRALSLSAAEIWTGEAGNLSRAASLPERGPDAVHLGDETQQVVARAGAQGNAWLEMWLPELVRGRAGQFVRSVSIRHRGELLGLLVLERPRESDPFTLEEDSVLVDLARQLGLALHNIRLDSALRASVDQLERRNVELQQSRARIVAVADDARRDIERNLHDGAQQRLAGLAVDIGLMRSVLDATPEVISAQLERLGADVNNAIAELRELAHGIYPPRLRDRGLVDALSTAAARSGQPIRFGAEGVGRYPPEIEAAVYFCCLEAMQNAAKYGGEQSSVVVCLGGSSTELRFDVTDDGAGFDPASAAEGHGIINMRDRVGAVGGELTVRSAPGRGTTVSGVLPARALNAAGATTHRAGVRE